MTVFKDSLLNGTSLNGTDPKEFITGFYRALNDDLINTEEDAGLIIDRYHTPDIVQVADGHRMDRDKLVAHTRPVRKNRPAVRMEVHEALGEGDTLAARYTLHVRNPKRDLAIEVCFFGRFAPDGRMREANMLTRMLTGQEEAQA
ncbi:nuclear transport factor 2 family protein [Spongiactinospora sp. 9N601]|uniref:nuclear transport factor 2 family protein n=1 Tax=Spongiactinospora sp. 9N601 TaxID=3375149 RepID=UPI0037B3D51C